jgi:hypothetical protein
MGNAAGIGQTERPYKTVIGKYYGRENLDDLSVNGILKNQLQNHKVGRDSLVGIATYYALDGSGIESRWGRNFPAPGQTGRASHPDSYKMGTGSLSGGKAAGAWR